VNTLPLATVWIAWKYLSHHLVSKVPYFQPLRSATTELLFGYPGFAVSPPVPLLRSANIDTARSSVNIPHVQPPPFNSDRKHGGTGLSMFSNRSVCCLAAVIGWSLNRIPMLPGSAPSPLSSWLKARPKPSTFVSQPFCASPSLNPQTHRFQECQVSSHPHLTKHLLGLAWSTSGSVFKLLIFRR
jgi:hypothetical protein